MKTFAISIILLFLGCLEAKKSAFDLNKPSGVLGGFIISSLGNSGFSIGGNISGFTSGSIILQLNEGNDVTINFPAATYSAGSLTSGSAYTLKIKTNPTGLVCGISNATGTVSTNVTNANISCATASLTAAFPTNGANWNDYIERDTSKDVFSQTDTTCTSMTGGYRTCIHGGEMRKFDLSSRSACTGLTASDSASALNWVCKANATTGGVTFYSTGLKKGKYLSDLIDWTTKGWKAISFKVLEGTTVHLQTNLSTNLWANNIEENMAAAGPTLLDSIGTIYIYTASVSTERLRVARNKVAIVTNPNGLRLQSNVLFCLNTSSVMFVDTSSQDFLWIEGSFDATNTRNGLAVNNSRFVVARNLKIQNAAKGCTTGLTNPSGIYMDNSTNSYFEDIIVANSFYALVSLANGILSATSASYNTFYNLVISNSSGQGLKVTSGNNNFYNTLIMNSGNGGASIEERSNFFANFLIVNSAKVGAVGYGLNITNQGVDGLYFNTGLINNVGDGGLYITGGNTTFQNFAAFSNATAAVNITGGSNFKFSGNFKIGQTESCATSGGGANLGLAPDCSPILNSDFGLAVPVPATSLATIFRGMPNTLVTDILNGNNISSNAGLTSITDWLNFDNFFRGIGKFNILPFASVNHRGECDPPSSISCSLWDFSLNASDSVLRNTNPCPTGSSTFTRTDSTGTNPPYLRNAIELLNDGVGNDNGICESNEDCLYTPNIGAYQGHGNIVASSSTASACADIGAGGTFQNIKLFQYATNGY